MCIRPLNPCLADQLDLLPFDQLARLNRLSRYAACFSRVSADTSMNDLGRPQRRARRTTSDEDQHFGLGPFLQKSTHTTSFPTQRAPSPLLKLFGAHRSTTTSSSARHRSGNTDDVLKVVQVVPDHQVVQHSSPSTMQHQLPLASIGLPMPRKQSVKGKSASHSDLLSTLWGSRSKVPTFSGPSSATTSDSGVEHQSTVT